MSAAAGRPSVLVVHEFSGNFGGAERYLELLCAGLLDAGTRLAAVVFVDDDGRAGAVRDRVRALAPETAVIAGRSRPGPIRAAVRAHQPDLLHWNFVDPFAFRGASWLLLPWGRPSVITDHLPQLRHAGPHWNATRALANRRIAAMIVVGDSARAEAARRWRRPPPLAVVPNGVPVGGGDVRRDLEPGAALRLLFVGRLTEQKGADRLVPILVALRDAGEEAQLRVVGEGPSREAIARAAAGAGLREQVRLAGFSPTPLADMDAADVLVAPSRFEGLPFTPLEAMSRGLPMVLSDIGPHRDLAGGDDGPGLQVVGAEPDRWAKAIVAVRSELAEASTDALRRAEAHGVDAMVDQTSAVYEHVLQERRPSDREGW